MICAFIISGQTNDSQSQMVPGPTCVLLILPPGQKACEALLVHRKITFKKVGCWEGQFKFWQQEIWKEVPLMPLLSGGGGRIISTWLQAREDLQYEEVTLCTVAFFFAVFRAFSWIFPLRISSFIWSMLTSVDHVPEHLNLPHWWTGI